MKTLWKHIVAWQEGYIFLPLYILLLFVTAKLYYLATGRPPAEESFDWVMEYMQRCGPIILAIFFTSLLREQVGHWLTKDEAIASPKLAIAQMIQATVIFLALLWAIPHVG